jgi:DHA2 family multidrug resistance protein
VQIWLANVINHIGSSGVDTALNTQRALAILASKVRAEAVTMAFADAFYLMAMLFFGALIFVPLLRRPVPASAAAQEAAH